MRAWGSGWQPACPGREQDIVACGFELLFELNLPGAKTV
jgi:hypothetical protein